MRLHEIPQEMRRVDALIEEADGEITPEVEEALRALDGEVGHKVDWICTLIRERNAKAEAYAAEATRLAARKKAEECHADRLRNYLQSTMEAMGVDRVDGKWFKASLQRAGRPRIAWSGDADSLPEGFRRTSVAPDLAAAQEAFDAGTLPEGFTVTYTTSLRLR